MMTERGSDAPARVRQCTNCGMDFEASKHSAHNHKYCSYGCRRSAKKISRYALSHYGFLSQAATSAAALKSRQANNVLC